MSERELILNPGKDPEATKLANAIQAADKKAKEAQAELDPNKKKFNEHFKGFVLKEFGKVKGTHSAIFKVITSRVEVTPDGTKVEVPDGGVIQAQAKLVRKEISPEEADAAIKTMGQEAFDSLFSTELELESSPLLAALKFAQENPEFCTMGTDGNNLVVSIANADKIPGAVTRLKILPKSDFMDTVREMEPGTRKAGLGIIGKVLAEGLQMATVCGNQVKRKE